MTNYNVARGHGLKKAYLIDLFFLIETSYWKKKNLVQRGGGNFMGLNGMVAC